MFSDKNAVLYNPDQLFYLPPEIMSFAFKKFYSDKNENNDYSKISDLYKDMKIWSIDVWSLGIMLIEIISGFPISVTDKLLIKTVDQKRKIRESLIYTEEQRPNN